jgi:Flp pilus assembly protein TadG
MNNRCGSILKCASSQDRRGAIIVLTAVLLVMIFAMAAFAIDMGYITLTKTQLRNAADGASLAGAIELTDGLGVAPAKSTTNTMTAAKTAARTVAALQRNGNQSSTLLDTTRDLKFGRMSWDSGTNKWVKTWNATPYNMVQATLHRDQSGTTADSRLPLLFAPVIGIRDADLTGVSAAALFPGVGVQIAPGSTLTGDVLPITLDDPTWTALMNGTGTDNYRYDPATGAVTAGSDGVLEVNMYPTGTGSPGNRGTINIGTSNNSTSNLQRQIEFGLNEADLAPYGGVLRTDNGPLILAGNPGISAAIKSSLTTIIGRPRLLPIFTQLTGNGANAKYTIVKFVGVRVLNVQLTGGNKMVTIQPATYSGSTVIPGKVPLSGETYWTKPRLVQ